MVVIIRGERHEIKGRLAEMIEWLIRRSDEFQSGATGVRFIFRGHNLKAIIEREEVIS